MPAARVAVAAPSLGISPLLVALLSCSLCTRQHTFCAVIDLRANKHRWWAGLLALVSAFCSS